MHSLALIVKCERKDLTQSYDKSPGTNRTIQKGQLQQKNATIHFDYTMITDRLRMVSWSSESHPSGVVKSVYGIKTFPLTTTTV